MSIKGVTDVRASWRRVGTLRKGEAKPADSDRPGKDLSYFRFVTDDADVGQLFREAYGDKPRKINVFLPFATKDENWEGWMEEYAAGGIKHRCDGETCVLWQDEEGQYQTSPKPCPGGCKPNGRLMVIVPELKRLEYVMVLTTSWNDCKELSANLAAVENTAAQLGRDLTGIPFHVIRVEREVSTPPTKKGGKRVRRPKWLLHITPAPEWVAMQIEAAHQLAISPVPGDLIDENGDDVTVDAETGEVVKDNGWDDSGDKWADEREELEELRAKKAAPPPKKAAPPPKKDKPKAVTEDDERPWMPEQLGQVMAAKIEGSRATGGATPAQIGLISGKLDEVWAGEDGAENNRRSVLLYLFAVDSAKELTKAQSMVLLDWLIEKKDEQTSDYPLKQMAEREAKLIVRRYEEDAGQLNMEGFE